MPDRNNVALKKAIAKEVQTAMAEVERALAQRANARRAALESEHGSVADQLSAIRLRLDALEADKASEATPEA